MCIGLPLQVVSTDGSHAWCEADGHRESLDMALVGPQPAGTWVLAFMGAARQVMDDAEALHARNARLALTAVLNGGAAGSGIDVFFADLVARSPTLPPHLVKGTP
jgi:hydrogenase expression/formation protein HypC